MTRSEHIRALLEEYAQLRSSDEAEMNRRIEDAEGRDPEIARLRAQNVALALDTMRNILALPTQEERVAAAQRMKQQGMYNNAQLRRRLEALGLSADALEPRYRCPDCRDTGYVGEAPARFCHCFEARLRRRCYEDGSMGLVQEENFERFDLNRIPEADGQRAQAAQARRLCEEYADGYPNTRYKNLLLMGAGGLGKTFLLNCVYARLTQRGHSAVRVTAFRMFEAMRRQHMGDDTADFLALVDAPVLLIDDLGTEPMMRNITVEYLFALLNERNIARRHTFIATNLTPVQLQERYGERVSSRLLDRSLCGAMLLRGKDLRIL